MSNHTGSPSHSGEQPSIPENEIDANFNFLQVRVRVTLYGEAVWNRYHAGVREMYGDHPNLRLQRDEDGYTTMTLRKVVDVFGADLINTTVPSPIELNFKIVTGA